MNIKLIAADMDDTLLNSAGVLSGRTLAALKAAMDRGIKVVLASGRMVESMLPSAASVAPNAPIIAYNGGVVYDLNENRALSEQAVPRDVAVRLARAAESLGMHVQGYQDGGYYFERDDAFSDAYADSIGVRGTETGVKLSEFIDRGQYKLLIIAPPERIAEARPALEREFAGELNIMTSKPNYLECTAPGVNKGSALMALAGSLGISPDEIMAFGDGQNDLEMLTAAGYGYAMANASEVVRSRVKHTAPSNDDDGAARVIEHYLSEGVTL